MDIETLRFMLRAAVCPWQASSHLKVCKVHAFVRRAHVGHLMRLFADRPRVLRNGLSCRFGLVPGISALLQWHIVPDALPTGSGEFICGLRRLFDWRWWPLWRGSLSCGVLGWFQQESHHITHLEMINIVIACKLWKCCWVHQQVTVCCDNLAIVQVPQLGRDRDPFLLQWLEKSGCCFKEIFTPRLVDFLSFIAAPTAQIECTGRLTTRVACQYLIKQRHGH